jgi:4-hydroxy-tetrahydrodipicolinate synthase
MKDRFSGIYPAVITPFDERGEVDADKLASYVDHIVDDVDGLFVCGSYGSGPIMRTDQRKLVAETVTQAADGRATILLHVGAPDLDSTLELARHGAELGVDALAAVTPYYYRHLEDDVTDFYRDLIRATDRPVFAYNNPKYSNYSIPSTQLASLAEEGLAGIKDSSGSIGLFYEYLDTVDRDDFVYLIGSQTLLLPAITMGGDGCVSGLSNAFPQLIKSIYDSWHAGDTEKAAAVQHEANALRRLTGEGIPVPFYHAVLPMLGVDLGQPRRPFKPLDDARVKEIRDELDRLGLLPS